MGENSARILLVGHCIPDAYALRAALTSMIPGVCVEFANDAAALESGLARARVLLVNRVLDGDFESEDGVELIRSLAGRAGAPRLMLISNYPEAQAEAEAGGALPGFGKRALNADSTKARLRAALGPI